ncbi:MAG: isopeptide-forming domain-containing fimbrial protein [Oscillospiraceae bacterium]|nr:isopeptide-forming domain-containing fimbrial protein [Oscillospiraceae bacterium]
MKNIKKIISVIAVFAVLFTMSVSVSVSVSKMVTAQGAGLPMLEILVDTPHSFNGQTIKAYLIFELLSDADGTAGYTYKLNSEFSGFQAYASGLLGTIDFEDFMYENADNENALLRVKNLLAEFIEEKNIAPTEFVVSDLTADDNALASVILRPEAHGLYYIDGGISLYNDPDDTTPFSALMNTDYGDGAMSGNGLVNGTLNVNTKIEVPTITKRADKQSEFINGEKITFVLNTTVPHTDGFESFIFNITDTMSAGLTFNNDIEVKIGGVVYTENSVYSLPVSTDRGFTLAFESFTDLSFNAGDEIEITYSAYLNDDAVIAPQANTNSVVLEYSNDPADWRKTTTTPSIDEKVYTYELVIYKYAGILGHDRDTPLRGVEFILDPPGDGIWSTDHDGKITFRGLKAGTYSLTEETALQGYAHLQYPIIIDIEATDDNGGFLITVDTIPQGTKTQIDVQNSRMTWLPGTGGIGTTLIYTGGALLIVVGICVLFIRSKKVDKK